eukprot:2727361-Pyramimonas_sp.AAC.1
MAAMTHFRALSKRPKRSPSASRPPRPIRLPHGSPEASGGAPSPARLLRASGMGASASGDAGAALGARAEAAPSAERSVETRSASIGA